MIVYCIVTAILNVLAGVVLGSAVLLRGPRRLENHLFAWFAASAAIWSWFYLLWQLAPAADTALLYARLLTGASIFIPISYFHFATSLTGRKAVLEIRTGYILAVCVAAFTLSPYLVSDVAPAMMFPYWPQPGPVFWPYIVTFAYYTVRSWMVLFSALRGATHWRRQQLGYVCFGTVVGWLGGSTNFLLWFGIPIPPVGNGLALVYILSVGYALMRFRLVEINVFVVKGVAYLMIVSFLSLAFVIFTRTFHALLPAAAEDLETGSAFMAAFLVVLGLFLIAPQLTRRVNAFLEERAFRGLADDRHRLREFISRISTISDMSAIFEETVEIVSDTLRGTRVELFFRDEFEGDYSWRAGSVDEGSFFEKNLHDDDWLVKAIRSSGRALVVYEQERIAEAVQGIAMCERAGVELAIPIHADRLFYGVLLCGRRGDNRLYSDLDISLLETLGIQIGLTVRARELERRTNRTENLISLGTMAAGLAHELRNPLVSIRTFAGLIRERGGDEDFRKQFSTVVERDVNRIGAIIDQVASFSDSASSNFTQIELIEVIHEVHDIAREDLEKAGIRFSVEEALLPLVNGNYRQLIQVFLNLLQNAVQALHGSASPAIHMSFLTKKRKDGTGAVVTMVADNGPGIPAGIRQRIFDPFVTTKNTGQRDTHFGMGLGLGIVKSIVEAHGGTIDVATSSAAGTTFYIELPCHEEREGKNRSGNGAPRKKRRAPGKKA